MLRGRLPWGLRGAVYLFIRSRSFIHSFVDAFNWGLGDVGLYIVSAKIIQGWIGEHSSCLPWRGLPLVVVFEISPSHVKTFHYPPHFNHQALLAAVRRLCVGSAESKDQRVRRPHHVQVQSPISRTLYMLIYKDIPNRVCR